MYFVTFFHLIRISFEETLASSLLIWAVEGHPCGDGHLPAAVFSLTHIELVSAKLSNLALLGK